MTKKLTPDDVQDIVQATMQDLAPLRKKMLEEFCAGQLAYAKMFPIKPAPLWKRRLWFPIKRVWWRLRDTWLCLRHGSQYFSDF